MGGSGGEGGGRHRLAIDLAGFVAPLEIVIKNNSFATFSDHKLSVRSKMSKPLGASAQNGMAIHWACHGLARQWRPHPLETSIPLWGTEIGGVKDLKNEVPLSLWFGLLGAMC